MNSLCIEDNTDVKIGPEKVCRRQSNTSTRRKKPESAQENKGTMRKKFFTLKLRGRIHVPKSSRKNNEQEGDSEKQKNGLTAERYMR
jgi:hypothetical protein